MLGRSAGSFALLVVWAAANFHLLCARYPVCRYEVSACLYFVPAWLNINLPCSDSQRPERDKIPAMCLTCLWFDIVISFFLSYQKQERVKPVFFLTSFAANRERKHFPFLPSHLTGKAMGSKLGYQPSAAAEERRAGLQQGVFLPKLRDKKQSLCGEKLPYFIGRQSISPGLLSLLSLSCWHVETTNLCG